MVPLSNRFLCQLLTKETQMDLKSANPKRDAFLYVLLLFNDL